MSDGTCLAEMDEVGSMSWNSCIFWSKLDWAATMFKVAALRRWATAAALSMWTFDSALSRDGRITVVDVDGMVARQDESRTRDASSEQKFARDRITVR